MQQARAHHSKRRQGHQRLRRGRLTRNSSLIHITLTTRTVGFPVSLKVYLLHLPTLPSNVKISLIKKAASEGTNSTWSLKSESTTSSAKIVQHLSPTSFVTQSTEITVSPRESIKDSEQVAIMVHISASGCAHTHDSSERRYVTSLPFCLFTFLPLQTPTKLVTDMM